MLPLVTSPAQTWLLCEGWRRHGPIAVDAVPHGATSPSYRAMLVRAPLGSRARDAA
jgi:hypothetical protein